MGDSDLRAEELSDEVLLGIESAGSLYSRLVIVVSKPGDGTVSERLEELGLPRINVSLELGGKLLEESARQRPLRAASLLESVLREKAGEVVLLDRLEILFEQTLSVDPLGILLDLARHRTVVALWSGGLTTGNLTYSVPGHPEYWSHPARNLLVVCAD